MLFRVQFASAAATRNGFDRKCSRNYILSVSAHTTATGSDKNIKSCPNRKKTFRNKTERGAYNYRSLILAESLFFFDAAKFKNFV